MIKIIKRVIAILVIVVLVSVVSLFTYFKLTTYLDFQENKKLAIEYVENNFDFEYELIDSKIGESQFPAPRTDSFIFYDSDNELYFFVYSYGTGLYDLYDYATKEKIDFQ